MMEDPDELDERAEAFLDIVAAIVFVMILPLILASIYQ